MFARIALAVILSGIPFVSAVAAEATFANWNIQTLTYPGDPATVFPDDYKRESADYLDLRTWRDLVSADVYFLQEVTSPAAIDAVFPSASGWSHCISGQYALAEGGMPVRPICVTSGDPAPVPAATIRAQYTAVAVRGGSPVSIVSAIDYPDLNVKSLDDGVERDVRWGLDVTLAVGASRLRVLVVHMKSGCFDDPIRTKLWLNPPTGPAAAFACDTYGRQLYPLRAWVEGRESSGDSWMIVGDFNRRLDAGSGTYQDEVWRALSGYNFYAGTDHDARLDIPLFRRPYKNASLCWREFRNSDPATLADADSFDMLPIEFFIFGSKTRNLVIADSERQVPWPNPVANDKIRLSDHCPESLRIASP